MYRNCIGCDRNATRVCVHPLCRQVPFLCNGCDEYTKIDAVQQHTHNNETKFISYDQILEQIQIIENNTHKDYLNNLRKRLNLLIGDVEGLVQRFEVMVKKIQKNISNSIKQSIQHLRTPGQQGFLNGKCLSQLIGDTQKYQNQQVCKKLMEIADKSINQVLQKFQSIDVLGLFNPDLALQHYEQGRILDEKGQFQQGLRLYKIANKQNPFEPKFMKSIGFCYQQLKDDEKALESYHQSILMGAKQKHLALCCQNIGFIWSRRGNHQKAISFYNKSLQAKSDHAQCYYNRGRSYQYLKLYDSALQNYNISIGIQERSKYYKSRANIHKKQGNNQKYDFDMKRYKQLQLQQQLRKQTNDNS